MEKSSDPLLHAIIEERNIAQMKSTSNAQNPCLPAAIIT